MNRKRVAELERIAQRHMRSPRRCHDWEHTRRVLAMALHLAAKQKADREIVTAAALLHDISRGAEDSARGSLCHAQHGAERARAILRKLGYAPDETKAIVHCIASHRYRGSHQPKTIEAQVLFDADKLDSIGAVGIGRSFQFAGEVGAKLLNDPGVDVLRTRPYSEEDTAYREYLVKLRHVKDRLFTREGRRIAAGRHRFMKSFFARLLREAAGIL